MRKTVSLFLSAILCVAGIAHGQRVISGSIINSKTNEPLSFAALSLKKANLGTVSNENGEFDFLIPADIKGDSLVVSYIGYKSRVMSVDAIESPIQIKLEAQSFALSEVVVRPLPPTYYIRVAMQSIGKNYPNKPFQTEAYYRERVKENKVYVDDIDAVFKSYYPHYVAKTKNQHQLMLYRKGDIHKFQFMKYKIEKEKLKEMKQAKKDGTEYTDKDIAGLFGGPENTLDIDFIRDKEAFMDTTAFNKFNYSFGKPTTYDGKELMVINFESKRVVDYQRMVGKVLLEPGSLAVVMVEYKSDFVVPLLLRPVLFALGYSVENPKLEKKYSYREMGGRWYPQNIEYVVDVGLTKRHLFKSNEVAEFHVENRFMINKIITDKPATIDAAKRFNGEKKYEEQIFNDSGISWGDVNIIKK